MAVIRPFECVRPAEKVALLWLTEPFPVIKLIVRFNQYPFSLSGQSAPDTAHRLCYFRRK